MRAYAGPLLLLGLALPVAAYSHLATGGGREAPIASLYLVSFLFFTGASGGAIVLGILAGAPGSERFRPVARIADGVAAAALGLANGFMMLDLTRPGRLGSFSHDARFSGSLFPDVAAIGIYVGDIVVFGYLAGRPALLRQVRAMPAGQWAASLRALTDRVLAAVRAPGERRALRRLTLSAIPAAVLLHSIPAWVLGHLEVRFPFAPALTTPLFIASSLLQSLVLALSLVILAATLSRVVFKARIGDDVIGTLRTVLLVSLAPFGYALFTEMQAAAYGRATAHVWREMLVGADAPLFWFVLLAGVAAPFLLLSWAPETRTAGRVGASACLVVLGALAERWSMTIPPLLGHAHLPYTDGGYAPAGPEVALTSVAYAAGLLLCLVLARRSPALSSSTSRAERE